MFYYSFITADYRSIVCLTILGQQFTNNVESISSIYVLPHVKFFFKSPLFAGVFHISALCSPWITLDK